jgi:hypothetical protein
MGAIKKNIVNINLRKGIILFALFIIYSIIGISTYAQPFVVTENTGIVDGSISEVTLCGSDYYFSFETTNDYGHALHITDGEMVLLVLIMEHTITQQYIV